MAKVAGHKHVMGLGPITKRCKKGGEALKYVLVCKVEGCEKKDKRTMKCICKLPTRESQW